MNEQQIRSIVNEEIRKNLFRYPKIPPHRHDGVDNIRIEASDLLPVTGAMGKITFARSTTYTLYFPTSGASQISFNGFATKSGGQIYAMVVGTANLKPTYYFQPSTISTVKTGGTIYPITGKGVLNQPAQSCTSLYIDTTGTNPVLSDSVSQFYLIYVFDGSSNVVVAYLNNLTASSVDLVVSTLASGWSIVGNFTII